MHNSTNTSPPIGMEDRPQTIVAVGASAGGLEALRDMLAVATPPTHLAFVVVQHLDPTHESMLAQLLNRTTLLDVLQCEGGEDIHADRVYIIPPGRGLAIHNGRLQLTDFTQPRGLRRPIDDFFSSLARDRQANAACVILSGTGADGSMGLRVIKENGGICIAQEPSTARYDGMPSAAISSGLVDFIKPPNEIIDCLKSFFERQNSDSPTRDIALTPDYIDSICSILKKAVGHDFSQYKRSTFIRRVERRMHVLELSTVASYLEQIRNDQNECQALFRDLLINVTRFFRNPDMFDLLREKAIEPLLKEKQDEQDIRVWVAGCSSGEEAYTLGMIFASSAKNLGIQNNIQIFATDIDEQMLQIAREGIYPASALIDIPDEMVESWVVLHGQYFSISNTIRDTIRFSNHSIIRDPPFSRINLVSCRNILIYFDDALQQQVMPLIHYALSPGGYLFLGPSETIGRFENLFTSINHHARIFEHSGITTRYPLNLPLAPQNFPRQVMDERKNRISSHIHKDDAAIQKLAERYAPPSMVVGDDGTVIAAYGKLGRYFDFPVTRQGGTSAFTLARSGLREIIGPLLRQARHKKRVVIARHIQVEGDYGIQPVDITCDPLSSNSFLFVFKDAGPFEVLTASDTDEFEPVTDHVDILEEELRVTRHKLRATIEELETANEELKSSNEEMMSMNEELQSTNEELSTVNDELKNKVDQLTVANSDVKNFFDSTELAVMVVDSDLKIRSFTDSTKSIFPLQNSDRGRLLSDVACKLDDFQYLDDAFNVSQTGQTLQRRVHTKDGKKTFSMRVLPYKTSNGDISGATIVMTDITDALTLERALIVEQERLRVAVNAGRIGIWEYCPRTNSFRFDKTHQEMLGLSNISQINFEVWRNIVASDDRDHFSKAINHSLEYKSKLEVGYKVILSNGEIKKLKSYAQMSMRDDDRLLVGATIDITPEHTLAETRSILLQEMNHRVKNLFAIIASMVTLSARSHTDINTYAQDFRDRIIALGRAHSLSMPSGDKDVISLHKIVKTMIVSHESKKNKIIVHGPEVLLPSNALSPLAMILHEWTTNASKYGVLGPKGGELEISWRLSAQNLSLVWHEKNNMPVEEEDNVGFGTTLIKSSAKQLGAHLFKKINAENFIVSIEIPLQKIEEAVK